MQKFLAFLLIAMLIFMAVLFVKTIFGGKGGGGLVSFSLPGTSQFFKAGTNKVIPSPTTPSISKNLPSPTIYDSSKPTVSVSAETPGFTPPLGFTYSQLSPYYKKVRIGSVSPVRYFGATGQFSLSSDYSVKQVNISGWKITTNKGNFLIIPRAVSDYSPFRSPSEADIILDEAQYLYFYDSYNPAGFNLRLNKCTGYLNSIFDFNPDLNNSCPILYTQAEIAGFSGTCQNFIISLGSCQIPDINRFNTVTDPSDQACRSFIERFNYRGCYDLHSKDADFLGREWRIWLKDKLPFDKDHDRLRLFDRSGLLVDEYVY